MTTEPRFIQIHTLHTYPAALINRDDAGLAKRLPLGNAMRTRISSQCLKRHWRIADDRFALSALAVPMAIRSRGTLELIRKRIVEGGVTETLAQAAVEALRNGGLVDKAGKEMKGNDALNTGQAVLMGKAEIDYLVQRCIESASASADESAVRITVAKMLKDEKKNIEALKHGSGLESALFGRMVTSDVLTSRDAAVYVAHAFTVHEAQVENDYFTVVDDLLQESGELGSAGIFDTELASGLYYGYVVVDVRQLIENLEGLAAKECFAATTPPEKRALAGKVVEHLLHLIATVSPGAKRGSTAPFDWAKLMLVEAGDWQPRSLAGAFHDALPLSARDERPIRERAVVCLSDEIAKMDEAYGATLTRRVMALDPVEIPQAQRLNLSALATWTAEAIVTGAC
ncbi:type I-E CRISPR-associated protein Cas7/Cse4/CasC [Thiocystis violacea]|uniref:type I-E CRISPR-associated protein Cas7/Cse4/CasC n=1 Tax=Thiocystis violacea TaxID=13725 RepID=UPI0019084DCE|nr:type I-E CRISPR-associated protein Cas7/Cse4/CasC [Thiocystis violacea]MBK1723856.1 type I-E CRISPR-associated protein Cas7/Cse4/CasC [Thiocystis violacea]